MELHTCLWNEVDAFSFSENDFSDLLSRFPSLQLKMHTNIGSFLQQAGRADFLLTWDFDRSWYAACKKLKIIFTPAAGNDWVQPDPENSVKLVQGTFHGQILSESLLGALLFMNHKMPEMIRSQHAKNWDRNIQSSTRLLANQKVLIIGFGNIGQSCARLIQCTGAEVTGVRRNQSIVNDAEFQTRPVAELDSLLPLADHVVLLLPASSSTDRFMNPHRLSLMKTGSFIYNFGRGNSLTTPDLLEALPRLGGAFLDVTEEEPLPVQSPLWDHDKITITPHSSCVYDEYRSKFIAQVSDHLSEFL